VGGLLVCGVAAAVVAIRQRAEDTPDAKTVERPGGSPRSSAFLRTGAGRKAEFVDGPICFQDDFEGPADGTLKGWSARLLSRKRTGDLDARANPFTDAEIDPHAFPGLLSTLAGTSRTARKGAATRVLMLDVKRLKKVSPMVAAVVFLQQKPLDDLLAMGPISIELDLKIGLGTTVSLLVGTQLGARRLVYQDPKKMDQDAEWHHRRIEIHLLGPVPGGRSYEISEWMDGLLVEHQQIGYRQLRFGITLQHGKAALDNVVIRKMVPAKSGAGEPGSRVRDRDGSD
jgi:hypothetical protein